MSSKLGGRSEVVDTPAVELFKYMELEIQKDEDEQESKKAEMYIQYLSQIFSQPQYGKPSSKFQRAKRDFENLLMPKQQETAKSANKKLQWDFDPADYGVQPEVIEQQ